MPRLETFVAYATDCSAAEAARFRALQPTANVVASWRDGLAGAVRGTVRVRLRTGSTCHPRATDREICVIERANEIAELVDLLRPEEGYSPLYQIPGCEEFTCEFFDASGKRLLDLGIGGVTFLRASQLWDKPASVRKESEEPLRRWLAARGAHVR